jgi:uncharacterized Tic20 family protein
MGFSISLTLWMLLAVVLLAAALAAIGTALARKPRDF